MRIEGNLETYEFSDLLQWLAQGNKSGLLTVSDGGVEYELGFDNGRIDMSSSSDPEQRLDSYLLEKGMIDEPTLARAERLREATQMLSGQVLVTLGAISEAQLYQALRDRTERILGELLRWQRGRFVFEGGERPASTMVPINLEVTKLLLECMHRLDRRGQDAPPAPTAVFQVRPADGSATQAIDGLALAEVLDPAAPTPAVNADSGGAAVMDGMPLHHAAMVRSSGPIRRMAPYGLVLLLSFAAGGFHLANIEASARAAEVVPGGQPIRFAQTPVPQPTRATPPPAAVDPPAVTAGDSEAALRERYEEELAQLRRELEQARRRPEPAAPEPLAPRTEATDPTPAKVAEAASGPAASAVERTPTFPPAAAVVSPPPAAEPAAVRMTGSPEGADAKPRRSTSAEASKALVPAVEASPRPSAALDLASPKLVSRPTPAYPMVALRHRRGATVTVRVLVGVDGRVEEVEKAGPKVGMGFDRAAEDAARASVWQPGSRAGEPTPMWADLRFEFKP